MSDNIIEIKNFSKAFGSKKAVSNLNFSVEEGDIFAFLGANGSGKTTTIRCLLDIYTPDSGSLTIRGERYNREMSTMLGYLPEERGLYLDSAVLDTIVYFGQLKGMRKADARRKALSFLRRVGLADKRDQKIKSLSSGQQQKIQLGITLINDPQLLILDEPTKGLDPVNRNLLMEMLHELNQQQGTTIVFSTHLMEEAEKIADRLVMLKNGKRALYGPLEEVKDSFGENNLILEYTGKLSKAPQLYNIKEKENNYAELEIAPEAEVQAILENLVNEQKLKIRKFEKTTPSLQQIFVKVSQQQDD